jgi:hypothetical protein
MKTSKIFRAAKAQLWGGDGHCFASSKNRFICNAIREAPKVGDGDKRKAINIVENLLGRHETLEAWLSAEHRIRAYKDYPQMQETRRAWLNHLIEHYESIGD